jgi:hypothetical protein
MQHEIVIPGKGRPYLDGDSIDHGAALVVTVPAVLGAAECAAMIARIEDLGPAAAPVTTDRGFAMMPDVRNNERVMFDDVALAAELYDRLHDALPEQLSGMRKVGVNERFRCYRYAPGQRFTPHQDGAFRRSVDGQALRPAGSAAEWRCGVIDVRAHELRDVAGEGIGAGRVARDHERRAESIDHDRGQAVALAVNEADAIGACGQRLAASEGRADLRPHPHRVGSLRTAAQHPHRDRAFGLEDPVAHRTVCAVDQAQPLAVREHLRRR